MKYIKHPWLLLLLSGVLTVVIKFPHLSLPYFFDETYSYYRAILEMADVGPTMLPGAIPIIISKGHPLFFYFLGSSWMKFIAGDSILLMRLFPLLISLGALYVFHRFAKRHTNLLLANISVVLLSLQPLFLGQASLVLPEILLFLLFMLSFDSYLSGQYGWYALFGSLVLLTKETGAVFIMIFGLAYLFENYRSWHSKVFWQNLLLMAVPVLTYATFLILHYFAYGVYFYEEHLGYITIDTNKVLYKFNSSVWMLLLAQGRNFIFYTAIAALLILLVRKKKIEYKRLLILCFTLIIAFMTFSILNFYVYRYIFPVLGISLLALLALIQQIKLKNQAVNMAYVICMISVSAYYSATKRGQSDADLGYIQFLIVHQQMVHYCEQQGWYDKEISGGYNMVMSLRDRYAHYLTSDKNFKTHHLPGIHNRDIVIYDSTCWPYEMPQEERNKLKLIKRFEYKQHWGEIYSTSNNDISQIK